MDQLTILLLVILSLSFSDLGGCLFVSAVDRYKMYVIDEKHIHRDTQELLRLVAYEPLMLHLHIIGIWHLWELEYQSLVFAPANQATVFLRKSIRLLKIKSMDRCDSSLAEMRCFTGVLDEFPDPSTIPGCCPFGNHAASTTPCNISEHLLHGHWNSCAK